MTTLQEAANQRMTGTVLIVWSVNNPARCESRAQLRAYQRNSLFHACVQSGDQTVCGRGCAEWAYETISIPDLAGRVKDQCNLCSECARILSEYDFSSGKEPSRAGGGDLFDQGDF
jgi:hypothetical protein